MFGWRKLTYRILKVSPTGSAAERLFAFYYDAHGKFEVSNPRYLIHFSREFSVDKWFKVRFSNFIFGRINQFTFVQFDFRSI